ncbi:hypothetical protein FHY55_09300 [Oceanicola sp. D3]|uniref:hypothetical protein n=1 Tax=Oceanicola sp. D3 TaxID=2587163 RepID=UPI0011214DCA|nr:hypothetical protein [Oceanicola sp. D3]QDC09431.1 hypothetical protein FHY55_09300 [Oceanicola sp. D3]
MSSGIWFGLAGSFGGHAVIWGRNTMYGTFYSLDSHKSYFEIESVRNRWGPGLGGGIGLDFYVISNVPDPWKLHGHSTSGWDFNISIGAKWGGIIKALGKSQKMAKVIKKLADSKGLTAGALKQASKMELDDYAEVAKKAREIANNMPAKGKKPSIMNVGIPVTPGLELSLFAQYGTWNVLNYRK